MEQKELVPNPCVADKIGRDTLAAEVPTEERGIPVPGREVPVTSGCNNQWGLWLNETEAAGVPGSSS